jgi:hypothetical protein
MEGLAILSRPVRGVDGLSRLMASWSPAQIKFALPGTST